MDTILVPVDFSDHSKKAALYALKMAISFKWNLKLLHAIVPQFVSDPYQMYPMDIGESKKAVEKQLNDLKNEFEKSLADKSIENVSIECDSGVGFPIDVIEKACAEDHNCSMIIMGTEGASSGLKKFMGSTSANIISRVLLPIILVPADVSNLEINNILFATNFLVADDIYGSLLLEIAQRQESKLSFLHISNKESFDEDKISMNELREKMKLDESNVEFDVIINPEENIATCLYHYALDKGNDLIALHVNHRTNLFQKIIHPSLSKKLALRSKIPLLIFS